MYNGWKNKETWLVGLWLGDTLTEDQEAGAEITADYIERHVDLCIEDSAPDVNDFALDLLNCALGEIDYHELASSYEETARPPTDVDEWAKGLKEETGQ